MGGLILFGILVLLVAILIMPALRARMGGAAPPEPPAGGQEPHEVVVHKLDDHRGRKKDGETPDPGG